MSFEYGFYNSKNGDKKYNSQQISRIFDGLISDGVYSTIGDCLMVSPSEDGGIKIGTGRAWFDHTWNYNDSPMLFPLSDLKVPMSGYMYLAIVLEIGMASRTNSIKIIEGEISTDQNTKKPEMAFTDEVHQYPLAYIFRRIQDYSNISASDITNTVGTEECPFVAGIPGMSISVDDLMNQFVSQYNDFTTDQKEKFELMLATQLNQFTLYLETIKESTLKWFNDLTSSIDENAAVNLQNQIGSLDNLKTPEKETLVSAINSSNLITKKFDKYFKGVIYAAIELINKQTIKIHIPKLINPNPTDETGLSDDYLKVGDVMFCRVFKSPDWPETDIYCRPKNVYILDVNEKEWRGGDLLEDNNVDNKIWYICDRMSSAAPYSATYTGNDISSNFLWIDDNYGKEYGWTYEFDDGRGLSSAVPYLYGEDVISRIVWGGDPDGSPYVGIFFKDGSESFTIVKYAGVRKIRYSRLDGLQGNGLFFLDMLNFNTVVARRLEDLRVRYGNNGKSSYYAASDIAIASSNIVLETFSNSIMDHCVAVYENVYTTTDPDDGYDDVVFKLKPGVFYAFVTLEKTRQVVNSKNVEIYRAYQISFKMADYKTGAVDDYGNELDTVHAITNFNPLANGTLVTTFTNDLVNSAVIIKNTNANVHSKVIIYELNGDHEVVTTRTYPNQPWERTGIGTLYPGKYKYL